LNDYVTVDLEKNLSFTRKVKLLNLPVHIGYEWLMEIAGYAWGCVVRETFKVTVNDRQFLGSALKGKYISLIGS